MFKTKLNVIVIFHFNFFSMTVSIIIYACYIDLITVCRIIPLFFIYIVSYYVICFGLFICWLLSYIVILLCHVLIESNEIVNLHSKLSHYWYNEFYWIKEATLLCKCSCITSWLQRFLKSLNLHLQINYCFINSLNIYFMCYIRYKELICPPCSTLLILFTFCLLLKYPR